MNRIQKVSSYMSVLLNISLFFLPIFSIVPFLFIEWEPIKNLAQQEVFLNPIKTPEGLINLAQCHWNPFAKTSVILGNIIGIFPLFWGLMILKSVFTNYQNGSIFTYQNATFYKYLGWLFFMDALVAKPLSQLFLVLGATLCNEPGHRYITLSFGTPNLEALFCGLLIIMISWIMAEAAKLQEEQEYII